MGRGAAGGFRGEGRAGDVVLLRSRVRGAGAAVRVWPSALRARFLWTLLVRQPEGSCEVVCFFLAYRLCFLTLSLDSW